MGCDEFKEAMILRLYGEPGDDPPGFEDHLADCSSCREGLEEMDEMSFLYREASTEPMPLRLRENVLSRRAAQRPGRLWMAGAAAAACLVVWAVSWLLPLDGGSLASASWAEIDFAEEGILLTVTPEELAAAEQMAEAPPRWDEVSFAAERVSRIRSRIVALSDRKPW